MSKSDTSAEEFKQLLIEEYGFNPDDPVFMKLMADITSYTKQRELALLERLDEIVNDQYELSISDIELEEHRTGLELPVVSKTKLRAAIQKEKEKLV